MIGALQLLSHSEIQSIAAQHAATKVRKTQASYNLFTISSYNSYLENFHSDIIASLLNPAGLHGEGETFLRLFIGWLNNTHGVSINPAYFRNTIVTREQGRLDIWLRDEVSKQSIIIENKINNAPDMDNQIDRYFSHAAGRKYKTTVVAYLSLDGTKNAPPCDDVPEAVVKNVAAYTDTANDMVTGWLKPCKEATTNDDSRSFIHQYIKLVEHLADKNMDNEMMESFYQFVSANDGTETVKSIVEMASRLTPYRADKLAAAVSKYAPFAKYYRYRPHYLLYEQYRQGRHNLKLDLYFEADGSATLVFWNTTVKGEDGRHILTKKLTDIGCIGDFNSPPAYNGNGYLKRFEISTAYPDMAAVDSAFQDYVLNFLQALNRTQPYQD